MKLHPVHACNEGLFNTAHGGIINIHTPTLDSIHIEDIAGALSKICRFGGHCKSFYSVAQHSVLVSRLADEDCRLEALLHDAAEAYLGDVIKPLKIILGEAYTDIEDRFMEVIIERYGLNPRKLAAIKQWDMQALEIEHACLQIGTAHSWRDICRKVGLRSELMVPYYAEQLFLSEYKSTMVAKLGPALIVQP